MTHPLTRETLTGLRREPLSEGRNRTKADVFLVEWNGMKIVAKDFRRRGFAVRNSIGRFSVRRECRAYEALRGLAGIPELVGRIDAHAFATTFIPGAPLPRLGRTRLSRTFFDLLERLLARVHDRGVAIADLHHRNVLAQEPEGAPALVDFSLALLRPRRWNLPARWIYRRAIELDRIALSRIRERYESRESGSGASTGSGELASRPRFYRIGRLVKAGLRKLRGAA